MSSQIACICRRAVTSGSKRRLSTSAALRDQRGSSGKSYAQGTRSFDPENLLEPQNQTALLWDDLPTRAFREFDRDAERLHYRRLIEWQLPELGQKYGQKELWTRPEGHLVTSRKREWAFEPDHDQSSTAIVQAPVQLCLDQLSSDAARHKFLLLLGNRYKVEDQAVIIRGDRFPAYAQNLKWCSDQIDETMREAEIEPEKFAELPVSPGGQRKHLLSVADFPEEWLPPKDLPAEVAELKEAHQLHVLEHTNEGVRMTAS